MMAKHEHSHNDVLIVGGGPVGLGLAIDLAQHGIRSTVIERSHELHRVPKGQNLTQRTGEHFRRWGISGQIRAASPIPRSFGNAGMVAWGNVLSGYHYDWFRRGSVNPYYFAENERLPQYATEAVLREHIERIDKIQVRYGAVAERVEQASDHVSVQYKSTDADTAVSGLLTGRYLVGCDGSRSLVREAAGIGQDLDPHDKRMVLLVFKSAQLHDLLEQFPGKSIFNVLNPALDGYWQFLGRVDLKGRWFYHAPVPHGTTRDNFDFTSYLHEAVGAPFEITFEHIGFWDLRMAVAQSYQSGRVFVAGDAAHSHPPYGGYGVNTGFEDIRNLSWKLAAQLDGWAGPHLLASYTDERRPVFKSTMNDFIGQMIRDDRAFGQQYSPEQDREAFEQAWGRRASGGNDAVTQYLPHYEGSPICLGRPGASSGAQGVHEVTARAGHHLSPAGSTDLFEHIGDGFLLIVRTSEHSFCRAVDEHARLRQVPLRIIQAPDACDAYQADHVLVRPDGFVAWAGGAETDASMLLDKAAGY